MKILFYLPVVTPWWFGEIIAPMLRALHGAAELHVIVAPLWRSTGIDGEQLELVADLDQIQWHVVEADDPAPFRNEGATVPGLLDLVNAIDPDLTLDRSADQATPALFPGTVRYIMEGGAAPFETDPRWVILEERLFAHGAMPASAAAIGARCADAIAPLWAQAEQRLMQQPAMGWRTHLSLPNDKSRPILAVPLQYEHEEDFFTARGTFPRGIDLIRHLLATLDKSVFLAVTDHPLNRRHVDRRALDALIAREPERVLLCLADKLRHGPTGLLAAHADAMLIDQSKSWSLAAFCSTPILRVGHAPMADWLAVSDDLSGFPHGIAKADPAAAQRWFGWHLATRLLDPTDFTLDDLLARVAGRTDDAMIAANLDRLHAYSHEAVA